MKLSRTKKWVLVSLVLLMAIGFVSYSFGFFFTSMPKGDMVTRTLLAPQPTPNDQSKVAIVQSEKALSKDIDYDEIKAMVRSAVDMAGGFNGLIKDGNTVAIKPNLVWMKDYTLPGWEGRMLSPENNGVTTDWRVTKAIVELVREFNPKGKVYVMEGGAKGATTRDIMKNLKYTPEFIPGVDEFICIEEDSGAWKDYNSPGLVKVSLPDGLLHQEYYMNKKYKEADVLISVPTLKNHNAATISGAIKNVGIGATPANIYGIAPNDINRSKMVDHGSMQLHAWIRDYFMCRPINFVIMDGLQGIQNGPTPNWEVSRTTNVAQDQMNMRLIVAGRDAVSVDTVEALLMGWDPQTVGHLKYLGVSKAGNVDAAKITVVGKKVDEVRKAFAGPIPKPALGGKKITDKQAPNLTVNSSSIQNGKLNLSLSVDAETVKVEVYVDGKLLDAAITSNYENISLDISQIAKGKHEIKVNAYDRFLNRSEQVIPDMEIALGSSRIEKAA